MLTKQLCYLLFSVFKNGNYVCDENIREKEHCFMYEAEEYGEYNFAMTYASVSADSFTNGKIIVDSDN